MSQHVVLGPHTLQPIGLVREHGTRVECIGLVPWFVPQLIEFAADCWDDEPMPADNVPANCGHWSPNVSPSMSVLYSLRVAS